MKFLKIHCAALVIEGLAVLALLVYWEFTLPDGVVFTWFGWTFERDAFLGVLEKIGVVSCALGAVGWLAIDQLARRRQVDEEREDT
ncbi:MAG TPA: hypothetical protein VMZ92_03590 [Planctomycetota bacterium]|nr:hypothetical protein [Planctomycetota bacterium]